MFHANYKEMHLLVRVEELENWKRKLVIGIPEGDVEKKTDELLGEVTKDATAPGFRKGKVPREMIERSHGTAMKDEALRVVAGGAYADAVREADIHPICDPVVELEEELKEGQYTLTATVEVRPEIELKDYENLEFTERVPVVSNDDVEKYLEGVREQRAEILPADRPASSGDIVVIDYEARGEDGQAVAGSKSEDYICELGKQQVPPEIEEGLIGASAGEEKVLSVHYPDDHQVEALAGKDMTFNVAVKDVRKKILPPVDDAFAKSLGLETLLDLRVRIRSNLETRAKSWARSRLEEEIVRELIERNPFVLPECLVENRLRTTFQKAQQSQSTGAPEAEPAPDVEVPEEFAKVYRPVVEHQLKAGLILGKVAELNGTEVTGEDIEKRVGLIAESQGQKAEDLMKDLAGTDALSQIEDELWLEKVHEYLVSVSKVTTEDLDESKQEGTETTEQA